MKLYTELQNERKPLRDCIPLEMPFGLFIDPTNWCNFHCSFCPRNQSDFKKFAGEFCYMSYELFEKIINDIKQFTPPLSSQKIKVIRLYYLGEPLLNKDFLKMVSLICKENICDRIEITSNGYLFTKDKVDSILSSAKIFEGDIYFRFSIYGISEEDYKKNCRINASPFVIIENIRYFYEQRNMKKQENVFIYAKKLSTFNNDDVDFRKMFFSVVDEVALEEPMNWSGAEGKNLLKDAYTKMQIDKICKNSLPKVCSYPFTNLAINSDGTVVCCCVDWTRGTCVGNINKESLKDIWYGEKLKNLRKIHLEGKRYELSCCKNCQQLPRHIMDNLDGVSSEILN